MVEVFKYSSLLMHKLNRNNKINFVCMDTKRDYMPLPSAHKIEINNGFSILLVLSKSQDCKKNVDL